MPTDDERPFEPKPPEPPYSVTTFRERVWSVIGWILIALFFALLGLWDRLTASMHTGGFS